MDGLAHVLWNRPLKNCGDNNFQYNGWLYGRGVPGVPANVAAGAVLAEARHRQTKAGVRRRVAPGVVRPLFWMEGKAPE